MILSNIETVEKLVDEVCRMQQGCELLESVWLECGSYGEKKIPDKLWSKMQTFFDFDDSE